VTKLPFSTLTSMKPFADYFSENEIIRNLCNLRVKEAGLRDTRQYVDRLIGHQRDPQPEKLIYQILPPRSKWARFRSSERSPVANPHLISLLQATFYLRQSEPDAGWAARLRQFILTVRQRVLGPEPFAFAPPSVRWELKKGHEYRAICRFSLEENLICSLLAKYLRDLFDQVFEPSSYAFRSRTEQGEMPTHHSAFEVIYQLKSMARAEDLFVAECDIRGFYDSVDHGVALESLSRVAQHLQVIVPRRQLHPRASAP